MFKKEDALFQAIVGVHDAKDRLRMPLCHSAQLRSWAAEAVERSKQARSEAAAERLKAQELRARLKANRH